MFSYKEPKQKNGERIHNLCAGDKSRCRGPLAHFGQSGLDICIQGVAAVGKACRPPKVSMIGRNNG